MKNITIAELRDLLKDGANLRFNADGVRSFLAVDGEGKRTCPDLAWLWDCATEEGNSQASVWREERIVDGERKTVVHFDFSCVGCCIVGIVMNVRYACLEEKVPERVLRKENTTGVYPEDVIKEMGGFLSLNSIDCANVYYDPYFEDEDDEDGEDGEG